MHPSFTLTSFPKRLKDETALLHQALENLPLSKKLLGNHLLIEDYLIYLDLMEDVVSEVESTIFPFLVDEISDLSERRKSKSLFRDFQALDYRKPNQKKIFHLSKEEVQTPFALGILYVIEGSTLGGKVIYKHIQKTLGLNEKSGAAYFYGYGEKTGELWKNFLFQLTEYEQLNQNGDRIIAGANFAFQSIHDHFLTACKT